MARAHALSKRLVSSSSSVNDLVWPYPSWARIRVSEALGWKRRLAASGGAVRTSPGREMIR
jgi:hypothetical protein